MTKNILVNSISILKFIVMESIFRESTSFEEFKACVEKLGKKGFVRRVCQSREIIKEMREPDKLFLMCQMGCFNAILPLLKCGSDAQILDAFRFLYGGKVFSHIRLSHEEEIDLMLYAADKLEIIKFIREETFTFEKYFFHKEYLLNVVLEYGSTEIVNYLFMWCVKNHSYADQRAGKVLFARADKEVIRRYIDIVRGFYGRNFLTYPMIENLYKREDLSISDKQELMLYGLRKMHVCAPTIAKLRKNGYLD